MKREIVVLIFYRFLVAAFGSSHMMLDEDNQGGTSGTYHGRYTRDIRDPELLVPRRVKEDGSFLTFTLPNFYGREELEARKKRAADANANTGAHADTVEDDMKLHLVLPFNGANHHVELTPNHEFISPDMVIEIRGDDDATDLENGIRFKRGADLQCHYRGHVRDHDNSRAALSLCEGVAGYVQTNQGRFFIEPLEEAQPGEAGDHVHMIYKRSADHETLQDNLRKSRNCGTNDNWESAWAEEIEIKNRRERLAMNGTSPKRAPAQPSAATHSIHRYIELGLFCDKKFLEHHKGTDYEQYILTMLNMASDYYHDASTGNQMDVVVVRIVYLEKEEKEIDLAISPDADKTLKSFAAWQNKNNPKDPAHPNHHDVGVLVTRYDICSNDEDGCSLLGLAYVAAACNPERAACINEDKGLLLGIVIAHEVGHNLGSGHDDPKTSGCEAFDKDKSAYVMSPYVSPFTLRWSTCSRKFFTDFLKTLGDCLIDNPKKPNEKYKFPEMLPGAMYDGDYQCKATFEDSTGLCRMDEGLCERIWCKRGKAGGCGSHGSGAAPGTKCGENKWCINRKCIEVGKRPGAVHGGWGAWGPSGECSRTCGGGVRSKERECDKPVPQNGGRYCLGERVKNEVCNTSPCDESKPGFRAVQCSAFDNDTKKFPDGSHTWTPRYDATIPCKLACINEKHTWSVLEPVVKDGTPCAAGTNNMCIGGVCRKVGCDWVVDSDAADDQCGICKGDGTQCTPNEADYKETGKHDYQKVVTVPKGSSNIEFKEMAPSGNTLAIKLEKGSTYILNGDHREDRNGEYPCAGDIALYSHPEPRKEEVFIKGPINEDIQLQYVFYNPNENPGVHYVYFTRSGKSSGSTAQYLWDFLTWGRCSAKCGGGSQLAQASCIEKTTGKVSDSFCKNIPRPEPKSRICGSQPCGAKWRVSQWSRCSGCGGKRGQQRRKVQCVKPAATAGGEDIQTELKACKGKVPKQTQDCTGSKPCKKCAKKPRSNVFGEENDSYNEKRPTLEEQKSNIDRLVDMGLTKYLEKPNSDSAEERSEKRNAVDDSKNSIDDLAAPSNVMRLDDKRDCPGIESNGFTTAKPGSIVKDNVPPSQIVLYEAPILNGVQKANLSDQAFQEDGDLVGVELDMDKVKVSTGEEAIRRSGSQDSPEVSAGAKSLTNNATCDG